MTTTEIMNLADTYADGPHTEGYYGAHRAALLTTVEELVRDGEELRETVQHLTHALRDATEAPTVMGEPVSLLRAPVKNLADIKVCYCPPDKCQAPVIMGRQVACTRKLHPQAIAAQEVKP